MVDAHQMLKNFLRRIVLRMGLAGKNKLNRSVRIIDHPEKSVDIGEYQVPSFICGHAASETDRQRFRRKKHVRVRMLIDGLNITGLQ